MNIIQKRNEECHSKICSRVYSVTPYNYAILFRFKRCVHIAIDCDGLSHHVFVLLVNFVTCGFLRVIPYP